MNNFKYVKKVDPEEYIDLVFKDIIAINSKAFEKESVDLDTLKQLKILLVNDLENFCIGGGVINKKSRSIDFDNLDEHDLALFESAKKYFRDKYNLSGVVLDNTAKMLLKETIENSYQAKIENATMQLKEHAKKENLSNDYVEIQLANYKMQIILRELTNKKPKSVNLSAGISKDIGVANTNV